MGHGFSRPKAPKEVTIQDWNSIDKPAEFAPSKEAYRKLMDETDIDIVKKWIKDSYGRVYAYEYIARELGQMISSRYPEWGIHKDSIPPQIVVGVNRVIRILDTRLEMLDLNTSEFDEEFRKSPLLARIKEHKAKVATKVEELIEELYAERDHGKYQSFVIQQLESDLEEAKKQIQELKGVRKPDELPTEKEFIEDLESQLNKSTVMQSSLKEELDQAKQANRDLQDQIVQANAELIDVCENQVDKLASSFKESDITDSLLISNLIEALLSKMSDVTPDKETCMAAIDEWVQTLNESLSERGISLAEIKREILSAEVEEYTNATDFPQMLQEYRNEMLSTIEELSQEIEILENSVMGLENQKQYLQQQQQVLAEDVNNKMDFFSSGVDPLHETGSSFIDSNDLSPEFIYDNTGSLRGRSPEVFRRPSPPSHYQYPELSTDNPISLDSSQEDWGVQISSPPIATLDSFGSLSPPVSPDSMYRTPPQNQISPVGPRVDPGTVEISPPSSTASDIRNRIHFGPSFDMNMTRTGTPIPVNQHTRVACSEPGGHMTSSPTNFVQTLDFMPPSMSPVNESSAKGHSYTFPNSQILDITAVEENESKSSLNKTLLLTSPRREQPLLVNIGVDPQPLTETEAGEHFICDISLNLQDAKQPSTNLNATFDASRMKMTPDKTLDRTFEQAQEFYTPKIHIVDTAWVQQGQRGQGRGIYENSLSPEIRTLPRTRKCAPFTPKRYIQRDQIKGRRLFDSDGESSLLHWSPPTDYYYDKSMSTESPNLNPSPAVKSPDYVLLSPDYEIAANRGPSKRKWHKSALFKEAVPESRSPRSGTSNRSLTTVATNPPQYDSATNDSYLRNWVDLSCAQERSSPGYETDATSPSPVLKNPNISFNRSLYGTGYSSSTSPSPVVKNPNISLNRSLYGTGYSSSTSPSPVVKNPNISLNRSLYATGYSSSTSPSPVVKNPNNSLNRSLYATGYSSSTSPSPVVKNPNNSLNRSLYSTGYSSSTSPSPVVKNPNISLNRSLYGTGYSSSTSPSPVVKNPNINFNRSLYGTGYSSSTSPSPVVKNPNINYNRSLYGTGYSSSTSPSPVVKNPNISFNRSLYGSSNSSRLSRTSSGESISPVVKGLRITYNKPPKVTPTSTRKYGLFTPTSIFRFGHMNLRRLFDFDSDRFAHYWSPPKNYYWDKSMSTEETPIMDRTFENNPAMDRTFENNPAVDRTFENNPAMDRTFENNPAVDRTFENNPAMDRTWNNPSSKNIISVGSPEIKELNRTIDMPLRDPNTLDSPDLPFSNKDEKMNRTV